MPFADVNGQRIHYQDTGGEAPPVICSHGFLMDHEMFAPQVAELAGTHRVITWDERAFGETVFDGRPFTYWDSARDLLGLLDHLGIERAVLVGMSQGGYLSLRAALLAPDRVRALVLIDTQARAEADEQLAQYRAMIDSWLAEGYQEELASLVAGLIVGDPQEEERWKAKWARWDPARLGPAATALLEREDITDRLEEIDAPALVVHGEQDAAIPLERAEELVAHLPEAEGPVVVAGAAHAASLTHPGQVNPELVRFLRALPG